MLAFTSAVRALSQLDDPVFLGVVVRAVLLSLVGFVLLLVGCTWLASDWLTGAMVHWGWLQWAGWIGWAAVLPAGLLGVLLAVWLFVPVTMAVAAMFSDRICGTVERRFYPGLPQPMGAPVAVQAWDGAVLGLQVLAFQSVALVLAIVVPGLGLLPGWLVTGWAIGRGLFVAAAMRRMGRAEALDLYARSRGPVLVQGLALALASTVPFVNLLVPVLGLAALTHVLHMVNGLPRGLPSLRGPW